MNEVVLSLNSESSELRHLNLLLLLCIIVAKTNAYRKINGNKILYSTQPANNQVKPTRLRQNCDQDQGKRHTCNRTFIWPAHAFITSCETWRIGSRQIFVPILAIYFSTAYRNINGLWQWQRSTSTMKVKQIFKKRCKMKCSAKKGRLSSVARNSDVTALSTPPTRRTDRTKKMEITIDRCRDVFFFLLSFLFCRRISRSSRLFKCCFHKRMTLSRKQSENKPQSIVN